ncbi:Acb2/Tad1 domain-containing protein [Limnoglobus roseus]|uniref:Acb2/Tad1 domain-containing protein n=1 Tax=Limnoglobus roseus TaxID=2598579 RepID=UPI0011EB7E3E|nr:hypothetical protein [Limnoglobus roseus]
MPAPPQTPGPIRKTFAYHRPSEQGVGRIATLRRLFSEFQDCLDMHCAKSREASVAATKLEECAMWAIKAVVVNDPESVVTE